MSLSLILACLWALAATITALLPMRLQFIIAPVLLVAAAPLLGFIGYQHGFWILAACLAGFISMFRHPLRYLFRRMRGEHPEIPK